MILLFLLLFLLQLYYYFNFYQNRPRTTKYNEQKPLIFPTLCKLRCCWSTVKQGYLKSYQVICLLVLAHGNQEKRQEQQPLHTYPRRKEKEQHKQWSDLLFPRLQMNPVHHEAINTKSTKHINSSSISSELITKKWPVCRS